MPGSTKAAHPSGRLGITFTEDDHAYIDDIGISYVSATTLVNRAFAPFDADAAAAAKNLKTGIPAEDLKKQWSVVGRMASEAGTRCHENCERQILGRYDAMNQPRDDAEKARFRAAWDEVEQMKAAFDRIEPEKLVFSPRFMVAGSIDILARRGNSVSIIDWKFVKALKRESFGGRTGTHIATAALPDSNFWHYALQLNLYEQILKVEGYIDATIPAKKMLNVYSEEKHCFDHVLIPELGREAVLLLAFNATGENLERIPF